MGFQPAIHNRRSIRLSGYNYEQEGMYFITICLQDHQHLFGKILNAGCGKEAENELQLSEAGKMVEQEWLKLPNRFPQIRLHEYVVMPNHFHGIIEVVGAPLVGAQPRISEPRIPEPEPRIPEPRIPQPRITDKSIIESQNVQGQYVQGQPQGIAPTGTNKMAVGDMIGAFKSLTTNAYIKGVKSQGWSTFNKRLWQRNFWEHIIRNENAYQKIADYIINNPWTWKTDKFNLPE